jgi:hypothetical protein
MSTAVQYLFFPYLPSWPGQGQLYLETPVKRILLNIKQAALEYGYQYKNNTPCTYAYF